MLLVQLRIKSKSTWEILQSEDQTNTGTENLMWRADFPKFSTAHSQPPLCPIFKASWAILSTSLHHPLAFLLGPKKKELCACMHACVCACLCTHACVSEAGIRVEIQACQSQH